MRGKRLRLCPTWPYMTRLLAVPGAVGEVTARLLGTRFLHIDAPEKPAGSGKRWDHFVPEPSSRATSAGWCKTSGGVPKGLEQQMETPQQ
mgnify:CR=1 FL=1